MTPNNLIPTPDAMPAPAWLMIVLEQLLFLLHILIINALLGSALIIFYRWFIKHENQQFVETNQPIAKKIPVMFALGINLGVAPLLFLQVTFGHLFYTSSVLMATFWILIIPLLVFAYYGAYIHYKKMESNESLAKLSLALLILFVLYIGFILVANNSLMEKPEAWTQYFDNRNGTILNLSDLSIYPRFFHFFFASLAIGGLFYATIYNFKKECADKDKKISEGLKIFGIGTAFQIVIGFWYLFSLPEQQMMNLIGRDLISSIILLIGIAAGIGAMVFAFLGKYIATLSHLLLTLVFMIITRYLLRMMYLEDNFSLSSLKVDPQWFVFSLFVVILLIGLYSVWYMIKVGFFKTAGRAE